MRSHELKQWLRNNSSGVYRPAREAADYIDRLDDAITRCNLMGYMPDSTTDRARKKLLKKCQAAARRFAESYNASKANKVI